MRFESRILVLVVSTASLWQSEGSSPGGNPGAYNAGHNYGQQQQQQQQQQYQQQPNQGGWQNQDGNYGNYEQPVEAAPQPESEELLPLPPGWSEHVDPSSGLSYYFNAGDGTTTWDRPVPEATPEHEAIPQEEEEAAAPTDNVTDEATPVVETTDEVLQDDNAETGHAPEGSTGYDMERQPREQTHQQPPVDHGRRQDTQQGPESWPLTKETDTRPDQSEQLRGREVPTDDHGALPQQGATQGGWGMRREGEDQTDGRQRARALGLQGANPQDRPSEQQKLEYKPVAGAPGHIDPRMQQQRPAERVPIETEQDPGGWGPSRTEQTRTLTPAWGATKEEEPMKLEQKAEYKPAAGAPGHVDPRMQQQQRPAERVPIEPEQDHSARQPVGWGPPRTEQTRTLTPAWGAPVEEPMKEHARNEAPRDRQDQNQYRSPPPGTTLPGSDSLEQRARQPYPYQTKPLNGTQQQAPLWQQDQSRPAPIHEEQHQQQQQQKPQSPNPQQWPPMPREDQRPPPQQYQQQNPQYTQRPPNQLPPGQQQQPQQQQQQRPPQQYAPGQHSQQQQGNYPPNSQYSNSPPGQYNQYGAPQQGYGQQPQGASQLTAQGAAASTAVRESLGTAWQGILGFSNRTKEAVGSARTTVVSGAKEASQSLSTTSAGTSFCWI
jgi:hypothetical protein